MVSFFFPDSAIKQISPKISNYCFESSCGSCWKKNEELKSTGAVLIEAHMRQERGELKSVINSKRWCLIKQIRRIRLQIDRLFFSKLLFHLMNINEELEGGYFIVEDWMQGLSLCLIMPLFVFMWRWRDVYAYSYRALASHPAPDTDRGRKDKESESYIHRQCRSRGT